MDILEYLIPGGILLGLSGLFFFFWTIRSAQYEDLDGAANRILLDDGDRPLSSYAGSSNAGTKDNS